MSFKDLLLDAMVGMEVVEAATAADTVEADRGTWLVRKRTPLRPYSRPVPRVIGGSFGGGYFLMGGVPL